MAFMTLKACGPNARFVVVHLAIKAKCAATSGQFKIHAPRTSACCIVEAKIVYGMVISTVFLTDMEVEYLSIWESSYDTPAHIVVGGPFRHCHWNDKLDETWRNMSCDFKEARKGKRTTCNDVQITPVGGLVSPCACQGWSCDRIKKWFESRIIKVRDCCRAKI